MLVGCLGLSGSSRQYFSQKNLMKTNTEECELVSHQMPPKEPHSSLILGVDLVPTFSAERQIGKSGPNDELFKDPLWNYCLLIYYLCLYGNKNNKSLPKIVWLIRPRVIQLFSCSTQLSMKIFLLINVKIPTIVGILAFMNRKNSILGLYEPTKC